MKHKVGDKVRVHTLKWFEQNCFKNCLSAFEHQDGDDTLISDMIKFCGQEVTICQVDLDLDDYQILEDDGAWHWEDWMFEGMNNSTNNSTNNNTNTISNPNIVEDFAKLIGVELDEEFYTNKGSCRYKFTADSGLMIYDDSIIDWRVAAWSLTTFLKMVKEGKFIKKWTPKDGTTVYFPAFMLDDLWDAKRYDSKDEHDKEMLKSGLYFRTSKEAIECAKKIIKQMKEG